MAMTEMGKGGCGGKWRLGFCDLSHKALGRCLKLHDHWFIYINECALGIFMGNSLQLVSLMTLQLL
jgi:hypothetical protein